METWLRVRNVHTHQVVTRSAIALAMASDVMKDGRTEATRHEIERAGELFSAARVRKDLLDWAHSQLRIVDCGFDSAGLLISVIVEQDSPFSTLDIPTAPDGLAGELGKLEHAIRLRMKPYFPFEMDRSI